VVNDEASQVNTFKEKHIYSSIQFHFVRVSSGPVTKGKSALGYGGLSMTMWHVDLAKPHEPRSVVPGRHF
jgi:hypothetical protein